jgi:hypothetical protein
MALKFVSKAPPLSPAKKHCNRDGPEPELLKALLNHLETR